MKAIGFYQFLPVEDPASPVKQLLVTNQLTRHSILRPGQRLDIPVSR